MRLSSVVLLAAPALLLAVLVLLTGVGSRRRGDHWAVAVVSAVLFPLAWGAWYLRDQRPHIPRRAA